MLIPIPRQITTSVVALLSVCLSACSSAPADVYLPMYDLDRAAPGESPGPVSRPTALLEGILIEDDGCLWVETDGVRSLMLWPVGSAAEVRDGRIVVRSDGNEAIADTAITGGGGEYGPDLYWFVVQLIGEEVPAACRASGSYWLGYDIRTTSE